MSTESQSNNNTLDITNDVKLRIRQFRCAAEFNPKTTEWTIFLERFQLELTLQDLDGSTPELQVARRNLLLKWIGMETYKVLADNFQPTPVTSISYEEIINFLNSWFCPTRSYLTERLKFRHIVRKPEESITQFMNTLRGASIHCKFGATLEDQLRDQFLFGLQDPVYQEEILRRHPEGKDKLQDILQSALLLEDAKRQTQNLGTSTSSSSAINKIRNTAQTSKSKVQSTFKKEGHRNFDKISSHKETTGNIRMLDPKNQCVRCGKDIHRKNEKCPASSSTCNACGQHGHWERVCVKSGNAAFPTSQSNRQPNKAKQAKHPTKDLHSLERSSPNDIQSPSIESIYEVCSSAEKRFVIAPTVNGHVISMEFDTAASRSVIGENTWRQLGSPNLINTDQLLAYPNVPIKMLGETTVSVTLNLTNKRLPLAVIKGNGISLFGKDWISAFGLAPESPFVKLQEWPRTDISQVTPTTVTDHPDPQLKALLDEYSEIFSESGGPVRGIKVQFRLTENAKPVVHKPRPVPFAIKEAANAEIDRLLNNGILESVNPIESPIQWASPVVYVPKPNGQVRMCVDFKVTINRYMIRDPHPLPRFEDIMSKLSGFTYFSLIDLKDAYLQLEVDPSSRNLLTIATHKGYFRFTRLPFGVCTAPAIFQRFMDTLLEGMDGVAWFLDDICVAGKDRADHLQRLRAVFHKLRQANLKTQKAKLRLLCKEIKYLGYRIDSEGIHPTTEASAALREQPTPTNVQELRSFLGSINYYSRFIPNLQARCSPLHRLLQKNSRWEWSETDNEIFEDLKQAVSSSDTLCHFNPHDPVILATDASERGLGAILLHRFSDGSERPIAAASRSLTSTEKRYSSIDREALAILFGINKFHQYLYGRHFTLRTDHKPLERIFGEHKELPKLAASRLLRWAISLGSYDYSIEYRSAKENTAADSLSRLPVQNTVTEFDNNEGNVVHEIHAIQLEQLHLTRDLLKKRTKNDRTLMQVADYIERGWPDKKLLISKDLRNFYEKREELSFEENILLWQNRIVIPLSLRRSVLSYLHLAHPGIVAMRSLAKFSVWWPYIDADIETLVKHCTECQRSRNKEPESPLYPWNIPQRPWERIHIDMCGPFEGRRWLIIIDAYSRWCEIFPLERTTSDMVIQVLRALFARYGICRQIVSDNGPQMTSKDFDVFCKRNGVVHIKSTPYHSRTNGMAERVIQTFEKHFIRSKSDFPDIGHRLQVFLFTYRITPHSSTGRTPAELFMGRRLMTVLDRLKPDVHRTMDTSMTRQKLHHDKHTRNREFSIDDPVWTQRFPGAPWIAGTILRRTGQLSYLVDVDGVHQRFHTDQLRVRYTK